MAWNKDFLGFVLAASLFVATPVFSAETKKECELKQYFYCAQAPNFGGVYVFMSGIFIVEDTFDRIFGSANMFS